MGNSSRKVKRDVPRNTYQKYSSQVSFSEFTKDTSVRSFTSYASHQSTYSVSRPWSRVSRKRWHETTLANPLEASKTAWPVPYTEALFLPEFKIKGDISEDDFKVLAVISKGAFGKVYKVKKKDTKQLYALKLLSKSKIISESAVSQVKEEVQIQSMCGHHPFIVNSPFHWQNKKILFIVSEFVSGGELFQLCQKYGPLPEDLVQLYVAELALALDFLHNAGVIYRDLKLENILLDSECHLKLIDFGLAKWLKYGSRTTTICGTMQYMAPEVVSMEPYGHAVDWWSLGVVMCCMVSGKYPVPVISDSTNEPELTQKSAGSLPENFEFSPAVYSLLLRLLERKPQVRLRSLLTLQQTAFFKDFKFSDVRSRKFKPSHIIQTMIPLSPSSLDLPSDMSSFNYAFQDF